MQRAGPSTGMKKHLPINTAQSMGDMIPGGGGGGGGGCRSSVWTPNQRPVTCFCVFCQPTLASSSLRSDWPMAGSATTFCKRCNNCFFVFSSLGNFSETRYELNFVSSSSLFIKPGENNHQSPQPYRSFLSIHVRLANDVLEACIC